MHNRIENREQLKRLGLHVLDYVVIGPLTYQVTPRWLEYVEGPTETGRADNAAIFKLLELDPVATASEIYGYEAIDYGDSFAWPEYRTDDIDAAALLVAELYACWDRTAHLHLTFPEVVKACEGYPGNGIPYPRDEEHAQRLHRIQHAAMGLACETGEAVSIVKDYTQYGTPIPLGKLAGELGDLKHFIQMMCNITGIDYDELGPLNAEKINVRYAGYNFKQTGKRDRSVNQIAREGKVFAKYNGRTWQ